MPVVDFQKLIHEVTQEPSIEGSVYVLLSGLSRELSSIVISKTIQHDLYSLIGELNIHTKDFEKAVAAGTNT